jgi:hypothetical protein
MQRCQANFGNAGAVANLLKAALAKAASRPGAASIVLEADDIDGEFSDETADPIKLLDGLYKVDRIRSKLVEMRNAVIVAQREGEGSTIPKIGHFVFRVRLVSLCIILFRSCFRETPVQAKLLWQESCLKSYSNWGSFLQTA